MFTRVPGLLCLTLFSLSSSALEISRSISSQNVPAQTSTSITHPIFIVLTDTRTFIVSATFVLQLVIGTFNLFTTVIVQSEHDTLMFHCSGQDGNNYAFCYFNVLSGRGTFRFRHLIIQVKQGTSTSCFISNVSNRMYHFRIPASPLFK